jgi:Phosphoesterase family
MMRAAIAPSFFLGLVIACGSTPDATKPLPSTDDVIADIKGNPACALQCGLCPQEANKPWTCSAMADWKSLPHDSACGDFDGKTMPAVVPGKCKATDPTGDALAKAQITQKPFVLPDGRRLDPAGKELVFEGDGGFPSSMIAIPNTNYLAVSDYGYVTHSVRIIDTSLLKSGGNAEVSRITYPPPASLDYGIAYISQKKLLLASSGAHDASIFAFDLDETTGALTKNAGKTIVLPKGTFPSAIDVSPDGKTLLVGQVKDKKVLRISLDDVTYGQVTGGIDVGSNDVFALRFDPNDVSGNTAYATLWTGTVSFDDESKMKLVRLDVSQQGAATTVVGKSPEEMAYIDARWMVVANALGDSLSLVDRTNGKVAADVPVGTNHGESPTTLAYDATHQRLYATLATENAVAVFTVDTSAPSITPVGSFPTAWWPTAVRVDPTDGTVYVLSGRGHGIGLDDKQYAVSIADEAKRMAGSIAAVPYMDSAALATATTTADTQNAVSKITGYPTVDCAGAPYDFPVSQKPEDGASGKIKHVFFIVRENKTFDGIMAGQPNVDAKADLGLAPGNMDKIWPNAYAISTQFAQMDNYYIDAEQSIQGHAWTVFGRTTDYAERRWVNIWGRGEYGVTDSPGVGDDTTPIEGNVFQFLTKNGVSLDNQGEFIGGLSIRDTQWPGGTTDGIVPDTLGACYDAWRLRVACNPKDFTYSWLVNDHTFGFAANKPNPAVLIATNDEATGMYLDALSHSPFWKDSLFIVVEDDPSQGGDHVDVHRTIALFASPWIKRGYVSHAHYDLASVHKLISDIYGKPYRNTTLDNAPLPLDIFTSTPDYTPFNYVPRKWTDLTCNPQGTSGAKAAERWDFTEADDQPGLSQQVWEALHALPKP